MLFVSLFIAIAAVLNTAQSGTSGTLHKQMANPILPGIVTYVTGLTALLVALLLYSWLGRAPLPDMAQRGHWTTSGPWWMWTGGLLGAVYVMAMVNVAEKAGAGLFMGISVTASVVMSLIMDHYALLGFKQHTADVPRMIGAGLMVAGLVLIGKY